MTIDTEPGLLNALKLLFYFKQKNGRKSIDKGNNIVYNMNVSYGKSK